MKTPKAPPPPDPVATAAAQSGANRDTAVTQGILNMTNQVGPDGSLTYDRIGEETLTDSLTGKTYTVPRYQATTTLSESGQALKGINDQTERNIATIGRDQSARIGSLLGTPLSFDRINPAMSAGSVRTGTYGDIGNEAREVYRGQYQGAGDLAERVRTGTYRDAGGIAEDVHKGQYRGANGIGEEVYKGQYKDTGTIDYSADRQRVEDALMARINPQLERDRAALETKLANQGIMVGSQAWNDAIDSANRASTDARNSAIANAGTEQSRLFGMTRDAINIANENERAKVAESQGLYDRRMEGIGLDNANEARRVAEGQALFDRRMGAMGFDNANEARRVAESEGLYNRRMEGIALNNQNEQLRASESQSAFDRVMAALGFNNANEQQRVAESQGLFDRSLQMRNQGINEATTLRNQPLNEIAALLSGSQVAQPNFINTPQTQVAGTDYQGAVYNSYNAQMQAHQQKVASQNAMMGGLFGLAGTLGGSWLRSDRRLKTDIIRVGRLDNGLGVYSYRYKDGGPIQIGVMADEVRRVRPEAVSVMPDGFDAVNYSMAVH